MQFIIIYLLILNLIFIKFCSTLTNILKCGFCTYIVRQLADSFLNFIFSPFGEKRKTVNREQLFRAVSDEFFTRAFALIHSVFRRIA